MAAPNLGSAEVQNSEIRTRYDARPKCDVLNLPIPCTGGDVSENGLPAPGMF